MAEVFVSVEQGKIGGVINADYAGRPFYSFHAVPYAKPPLGELRFKAPQPPESWKGIRNATKEASECYSRHMITDQIVGSEDCLYLNVYTAKIPSQDDSNTTSFPVIFWIHGGAFVHGSSKRQLYSPEFLIGHDVVVVTINYRLGLLGFLSLEDPSLEVPGNAGLKDMVMALQWVQRNIAYFSGNPHNVTIFGQSAGAGAVEYLTLSPLTKGLFHRAILHSGSVLNTWASGKSSVETLAKALGVDTTNEEEILKLLQELPVDKLFEMQERLPETFSVAASRPFGPVVEKAGTPGAFLTETPLQVLKSAKYHKVPAIFLYTKEEAIVMEIYLSKSGLQPIHKDFENSIPLDLQLSKGSNESLNLAQEIKRFYYKDKEPSLDTKREYYNLETDSLFLRGLYRSIRIRLATSDTPIYFCRFSLDAGLNFYKAIQNARHLKGASHGDEMGYLFKSSVTPPNIQPESVEDKTLRRMTKLWTNFAKYGSPIAEKDPLIDVEWKPAEAEKFYCLEINKELSLVVNPDFDRMAFWDEIYKKYVGRSYV